jgi:tRNA 5-methylaminomethyl-2-thiouridine biosynthesis bifunctional protein
MTSPPPSILWREGEPPRSAQFGDLYYSAEGGLDEARQVFLAGCALPEAWRGRRAFCVGELGFGTGLNIIALLELWARCRPPDGRLAIFSVEAFPLEAADAARALAAWPELAPIAARLLARWPGRRRGFHRIDLPELHATLDLAVIEAADALAAWSGRADAWFLDGFAPALNPQMWRAEVLEGVARRSAPGARLATYTVAGKVRRGLAAAGFTVNRAPGFGAKRQRLEAQWPGDAAPEGRTPSVAVLGAGIAGAALARAFCGLGVSPRLFDTVTPAASASPAALVTPRLDAGLGPPAALFAQAFARARALYAAQAGVVVASGVMQLAVGAKDESRFAAIARSDLFEPGEMRVMDAAESGRRLGEPAPPAPPALAMETGLVIQPAPLLAAWLPEVCRIAVSSLQYEGGLWRLLGEDGRSIAEAEILCVACGMASAGLVPGLALRAVRGQASFAPRARAPTSILFGGYVVPAPGGVMFGATHDRDDDSLEPRADDHQRNLAALAEVLPGLAARLGTGPFEAHVGVRATTADYLPIAGAAPGAPAGLFVLTGLGSRGFTLAPLLAEHIAAVALGAPSPLPGPLADLVDPARFERRARRRGRPQPLAR